MKQNRYYFVLADKATDCAMNDQIVLILRFADKNNIIRKDFVNFFERKNSMTSVGLYQKINLVSIGLDMLDCGEQKHDGASTVGGRDKWLQVQICRVNPKALYKHCAMIY